VEGRHEELDAGAAGRVMDFAAGNNAHYGALFERHGQNERSVGYNDDGSHPIRLHSVIDVVRRYGARSVFEVGVG
jgi:hypothetical protein